MRRIAIATIVLLAACGGGQPTTATSVELAEGSIEASSTLLQAGPVAIAIVNAGEFTHTLVITSGDGTVVAATGLLPPGDQLEMGVTLPPGAFQFTCRIVSQGEDGQVFDHYQLGMSQAVTVQG
jgi:uncharacterized cupredoxin-like copper-binding protein